MHDIIQGNCLEVLTQLEDNSIDAIVTDPPYELGFMGKSWDNTGIANNPLMWAECLRVLKPGGHLLAFSGTRTYHRMAVAIEDAGFEVRDMIEWVYGSGFPKSHNIGKNIEKIKVGGIKNLKQIGTKKGIKVETGTHGFSYSKEYVAGKSMGGKQISGDIPVYEINNEWEGWGTALKPAHEPICMARKPLEEKTVAENVLKYGTGGINIDESRVEADIKNDPNYRPNASQHKGHGSSFSIQGDGQRSKEDLPDEGFHNSLGRFPANLIHDNSEEVRECFPETKSGGTRGDGVNNSELSWKNTSKNIIANNHIEASSGNASRFFKSIIYQAKASKSERNKGCEELGTSKKFTAGNYSQSPTCKDCNLTLNGTNDHSECSGEVYYKEMESKNTKNNHPTVKPIALMEYLIKMVTPKGGIVLDPFAGSGSTLVAAKQNGFQYVGIELDKDYCIIAESRLKQKTLKQEVLF